MEGPSEPLDTDVGLIEKKRVKEQVDTFSIRTGRPYTVNAKRNTWRMEKPA